MKILAALVAMSTLALALPAAARPMMHHHHHKVCTMRHHHRVCTWR